MYIYDLATTGTISFSDFLVTTDLISQVSQTTQLRARLRAVLKENRAGTSSSTNAASKDAGANDDLRAGTGGVGGVGGKEFSGGGGGGKAGGAGAGEAAATDWLTIVKTIEEYLPYLLSVFNCVQTDDLILRYEPIFSWRTSISSTRFRGPQRVDLPGLHYELASTLLTYALTLSNFAGATVQGLGSFERDRSISAEERKAKDDRLRWAADTLCRASGILLYLSQELLPKWRDAVGRIDGLPPDLTTEATLALSKICLAEAQALSIRKLVSPSVAKAVDTVTPGPPLEKGHPSPSLLAKLHLNVVEELESAVGLLKTVAEKGKGGSGRGSGSAKARRGGGDAGLSANHEHELSLRISGARDHAFNDDDDDPQFARADANGKSSKGGLFSKFKRSNKDNSGGEPKRVSGPYDASPSPSLNGGGGGGGGGGGNSFYAPPSSSSSIAGGLDRDLDITSSLLKYLTFSATFHRSMAYKWLGIDSGESSSKIGAGIAFLSLSSSLLSSSSLKDLSSTLSNISISSSSSLLLSSSSVSSSSSSKPLKFLTGSSRTGIVEQELATIQHWLESYRKLNDTVSFQPVPAIGEVQSKVPAGRSALALKPFRLPVPSYGPGSANYRPRGGEGSAGWGLAMDQLHLLDDDHPARKNLVALQSASSASSGGIGGGGENSGTHAHGGGAAGSSGSNSTSGAGQTEYAGQGAYY